MMVIRRLKSELNFVQMRLIVTEIDALLALSDCLLV